MEQKQIQYVLIALALILALVGSYFGITLPAPDVPTPTSRAANVPCYFEPGGTGLTCGSGGTVTIGSGATLAVSSGATETHTAASALDGGATVGGGFGSTGCTISTVGALSCDGAATIGGAATITGTLTLAGAEMSGPVRFGSASTVVSGTLIAHGLATTPTVALLTAGATITTPLFVQATNATSITVGINDEVSVTTVYWLAGK